MVVKWGHYTRFAGYGITRTIEVHDPSFDDATASLTPCRLRILHVLVHEKRSQVWGE
jgi:hypothetical protein